MYYLYFMTYKNGTYSPLDIVGRFATEESAEDVRDYIEYMHPEYYTKIKYEA